MADSSTASAAIPYRRMQPSRSPSLDSSDDGRDGYLMLSEETGRRIQTSRTLSLASSRSDSISGAEHSEDGLSEVELHRSHRSAARRMQIGRSPSLASSDDEGLSDVDPSGFDPGAARPGSPSRAPSRVGDCPVCRTCVTTNNGTTKEAILRAIQAGCGTCRIIWSGIKTYYDRGLAQHTTLDSMSKMTWSDARDKADGTTYTPMEVQLSNGVTGGIIESISFHKLLDAASEDTNIPDEPTHLKWCIQYYPQISRTTSCEEALDCAKSWLKSCLASRDACKLESSRRPFTPTRLLQLRAPDLAQQHVRLIHPGEEQLPYACLSHCWGPVQPLRTLESLMADFGTQIEWTSLPRTFQDAITAARYLEIDYLWIDSLCIIQDSREDWARESASMADIYENGVLTLSATHAKDGKTGCFSAAEEPFRSHQITMFDDGASHPTPYYVRRKIVHETDEPLDQERFPLLTRAWCFQERLLSPRILHFCREELAWECRKKTACQCGRSEVSDEDKTWGEPDFRNQKWDSKKGLQAMQELWSDFVITTYPALQITYQSDILPALSGIATRMHELGAGQYLAGLWENNLLTELLWEHFKEEKPRKRPEIWRAPTWSWASAIGSTSVPWLTDESSVSKVMTVLQVHYEPKSANPFGEASTAYIRVSTRVTPLLLQYHGYEGYEELSSDTFVSLYTLKTILQPEKGHYCGLSLDVDLEFEPGETEVVWAAQVLEDSGNVHYLILRCKDEAKQVFQRIGSGSMLTEAFMSELSTIVKNDVMKSSDDLEKQFAIDRAHSLATDSQWSELRALQGIHARHVERDLEVNGARRQFLENQLTISSRQRHQGDYGLDTLLEELFDDPRSERTITLV